MTIQEILATFLFFFVSSSFACTVTDDTKTILTLDKPALRIISLAPDLTEILFALGVGDRVVGVMKGSDYPLAAKKIPIVANYVAINQEAILLLHPDLIVAWDVGATKAHLVFFQKLGIPVYLVHPVQLTDVTRTIKNLSCLTGVSKAGEQLAKNFLHRYQGLQQRYSHAKKVSVFYEVWSHPLMTVNQQSWINQAISLCGGVNIFAEVRGAAPTVNPEAVLQADPDVIISGEDDWRDWPQLTAVHQHHICAISQGLLERAGPRLLDGASLLCNCIEKAR